MCGTCSEASRYTANFSAGCSSPEQEMRAAPCKQPPPVQRSMHAGARPAAAAPWRKGGPRATEERGWPCPLSAFLPRESLISSPRLVVRLFSAFLPPGRVILFVAVFADGTPPSDFHACECLPSRHFCSIPCSARFFALSWHPTAHAHARSVAMATANRTFGTAVP